RWAAVLPVPTRPPAALVCSGARLAGARRRMRAAARLRLLAAPARPGPRRAEAGWGQHQLREDATKRRMARHATSASFQTDLGRSQFNRCRRMSPIGPLRATLFAL